MNPWNMLVDGLGATLAFFYEIVPNYGIAIILLTLAVSLLLFPLTLKQTRSMKAMQEIQPEVKKIQKEYKEDREEMQKRLMELYQERGVNPAAGCLPLLLQMPIWFALFSVLRIDVAALPAGPIPEGALNDALQAGDTSFLGMDLLISPAEAFSRGITEAIPYLILLAVVVAAGFYQQVQTTRRNKAKENAPEQPQGMQTAMKIMPVFFGFISWGFPTGLVLYFATSNLFRIGQQAVILRLDATKEAKDAAAPTSSAAADSSNGQATAGNPEGSKNSAPPEAPKSQRSPNASKKRKKRRRK